jgi:cobyrinic acid a,c-diamide synthase
VSGADAGSASATPGLIIAAPASGSGKTVFTLGLIRHWARSGLRVASAKVGPDYIDPAFHAAASGQSCFNLDLWAMRPETLRAVTAQLAATGEVVVCEGVMGLFDGATADTGSTADLAVLSGWPVLLVVDARAQAASAAAVVRGFAAHRPGVGIAAVVFNRVGGERHAAILREACERALPAIPVLGCLPRVDGLALPERHLGLVQALEHPDLAAFLDRAADVIAAHVDTGRLRALARPGWMTAAGWIEASPPVPPIGQRIAVASDAAFAFRYPTVINAWKDAGAEVIPFSPLADEAPSPNADAVYLPGGYPELYPGLLAGNLRFLDGLRQAAGRGAVVFGECGGYMVMGEGLIDAKGARHAMAGLLPLETSFADRSLHLGYRSATLLADGPLGAAGTRFRGHEFHFARTLREGPGSPLFTCADAAGRAVGATGLASGRTIGSFIHLIDRAAGTG